MTRGEVRWCDFPPPDKRRPVVILTRGSVLPYLHEVTIVPLTTRVRGIASELRLDRSDGMVKLCVANFDHVQTVPKNNVGDFITRLSTERMDQARAALLFALGFD